MSKVCSKAEVASLICRTEPEIDKNYRGAYYKLKIETKPHFIYVTWQLLIQSKRNILVALLFV